VAARLRSSVSLALVPGSRPCVVLVLDGVRFVNPFAPSLLEDLGLLLLKLGEKRLRHESVLSRGQFSYTTSPRR